ncbi:unnamed protein product, partial [Polarella glacialis]
MGQWRGAAVEARSLSFDAGGASTAAMEPHWTPRFSLHNPFDQSSGSTQLLLREAQAEAFLGSLSARSNLQNSARPSNTGPASDFRVPQGKAFDDGETRSPLLAAARPWPDAGSGAAHPRAASRAGTNNSSSSNNNYNNNNNNNDIGKNTNNDIDKNNKKNNNNSSNNNNNNNNNNINDKKKKSNDSSSTNTSNNNTNNNNNSNPFQQPLPNNNNHNNSSSNNNHNNNNNINYNNSNNNNNSNSNIFPRSLSPDERRARSRRVEPSPPASPLLRERSL